MVKGFKKTEVGLIPNDWEVKMLGEISNIFRGGSPRPIESFITMDIEGINWIKIGDVNKEAKYINSTKERIIKNGAFFSRMVNEGDFLLSNSMSFGRPYILKIKGCIHDGWLVIQDYQDTFNSDFLYYILSFETTLNQYKTLAAGSTVLNLNKEIVNKVYVQYPKIKEQEFIAEILSDIDVLISNFENLLTKKRNIKTGAMQELIKPKQGWEMKKLGEVCQIKKGQMITDNTRIQGNIPVIAGGKTPAYYHNKANRFGKTITISGSGASAGYVAFHSIPIFASDCSTIEEAKEYCIEFIYFLLQLFQEKIFKMQTGGAQPHVHPSDLFPIEIPFPTLDEQKHISKILFDIDNEIQEIEKQLEKQKMIKQGMMQSLLTGKIRLI